jgi:hypothetical protein
MDKIYILAAAIALAGFLSGGVYSVAGSASNRFIVVNKFTGSGWACDFTACWALGKSAS